MALFINKSKVALLLPVAIVVLLLFPVLEVDVEATAGGATTTLDVVLPFGTEAERWN